MLKYNSKEYLEKIFLTGTFFESKLEIISITNIGIVSSVISEYKFMLSNIQNKLTGML